MAGTIIITAANSSLALPSVDNLLSEFPQHTLVLTVRNLWDADLNTKKLRAIIAKYSGAKALIHQLDLANLSDVHVFGDLIADKVEHGSLPPLTGLICNAFHWNLSGGLEMTEDGYEKTFQINHIAQAALVLRLLGSFSPDGGRVVLLASDAHWPGKNGLEKYPPTIPEELELLSNPAPDPNSDNMGRGFQKYANSKLAVVTWMYALNHHLEKDSKSRNITAVAINPGNLSDSRALRTNTPMMLVLMSRFIIGPLWYLLSFGDPTLRRTTDAATDLVALATRKAYAEARGYFTLLKPDISAPESREEQRQQKLWTKTLQWAKITPETTALTNAFK
ncbi:MAG: hypothetical protein Q9174_001528 [Haloplaca sp. 1 TL-2023]